MKIRILGCGGSLGVPQLNCSCNVCRSILDRYSVAHSTTSTAQDKNIRTRSSIMVSTNTSTILVDFGPDIKQQLMCLDVKHLNAILCTHAHADHIYGIDDLKTFQTPQNPFLNVHLSTDTYTTMHKIMRRIFIDHEEASALIHNNVHPNRINVLPHIFSYAERLSIEDIEISPIELQHGKITSSGFIFNNSVAYCTDVNSISDSSMKKLQSAKLDLLIVQCLQYQSSIAHAHLQKTLSWIDIIKPRKTILTHMNHHIDYCTLSRELSNHEHDVEPGYDGLEITM